VNVEVETCWIVNDVGGIGAGDVRGLRERSGSVYYEVCAILNEFVGQSLVSYLGQEEAQTADRLIAARHSAKKEEIERRVREHRGVFERKTAEERAALSAAQKAAATGWLPPATRTPCPACGSDALLIGFLEGTSEPTFRDGSFILEQRFLASSLSCGACALELRDIEELLLGNVQPHYTMRVHTDLHEFFDPDDVDGYMNM
jgi:hypothetical protein